MLVQMKSRREKLVWWIVGTVLALALLGYVTVMVRAVYQCAQNPALCEQ
jgi:hypothetical protein